MYPQYPQQQQPPVQYPAPQYPQYPAPQYGAPAYYPPPPPPQAPVPSGDLDDFFDQPTTGSKAWVFKDRPIGTRYAGIVARPVTNGDIRNQTDQQGQAQRFRDGRPKYVMVVPMLVPVTSEFPEGQASWWVKGQARDELVRAMAEAGAPAGPPEAGAAISVTLVGMRPIPGFNPAFQYRITYARPTGIVQSPSDPYAGQHVPDPQQLSAHAVSVMAPQAAPVTHNPNDPPPFPGPYYAHSQPQAALPPDNHWTAPQFQQPAPPPAPAPAAAQPAPAPAPAPVMAANTLSEEQQRLLAQLTG